MLTVKFLRRLKEGHNFMYMYVIWDIYHLIFKVHSWNNVIVY